MVPLAHELIVDDLSKIAVVKLEDYWMDDNRWDLYLPAGSYRLCIATREVAGEGLAPPVKSVPIRSGRHQLALLQNRDKEIYRIRVTRDGDELLSMQEPKGWDPGIGSQGGGAVFTQRTASPRQTDRLVSPPIYAEDRERTRRIPFRTSDRQRHLALDRAGGWCEAQAVSMAR